MYLQEDLDSLTSAVNKLIATAITTTTPIPTGTIPLSGLAPSSASARLIGRGSAGAGVWEELSLGSGLSINGTVLSAANPAFQLMGSGDEFSLFPAPGDNFQSTLTGLYVPYTGAITDVNLGAHNFTLTGTIGIGIAAGANLLTASKNANNDATIKVTNLSSGTAAYSQLFAINDAGIFAEDVVYSSGATGTTYGLANANLVLYDSNGVVVYGTQGNVNAYIGTNSTIRVTILNTGEVGIGVSPTAGNKLEVNGTIVATKAKLSSTNETFTMTASTGTSAIYQRLVNTSGDTYFGTESSAGGAIFVGSSAYAGVIGVAGAKSFQIATTNTVRFSVLSGGNIELTKLISSYNGIATVSNGVPAEYATIDTTGLTANVGATTFYAVPASGAGMYRVSAYVVETTAGSISSTLPNVQVVYTDVDSNTSVTLDVTPVLGVAGIGQTGALTSNTVGTVSSGVVPIYVKLSTTIQYQTVNYASTAAGMTYAIHLKLEAL